MEVQVGGSEKDQLVLFYQVRKENFSDGWGFFFKKKLFWKEKWWIGTAMGLWRALKMAVDVVLGWVDGDIPEKREGG